MTLTLEHFLTIGALLFAIGLMVALSKRNAIGVLMGVELMLNATTLTASQLRSFRGHRPAGQRSGLRCLRHHRRGR